MAAAFGFVVLPVTIVDQRVEAFNRFGPDVAAPSAIAAVGAAIFDILLPPEGDTACAARSGLNVYLGLIEELHNALLRVSANARHVEMIDALAPAHAEYFAAVRLHEPQLFQHAAGRGIVSQVAGDEGALAPVA